MFAPINYCGGLPCFDPTDADWSRPCDWARHSLANRCTLQGLKLLHPIDNIISHAVDTLPNEKVFHETILIRAAILHHILSC